MSIIEDAMGRAREIRKNLSAMAAVILAPAFLAGLTAWQTHVGFPEEMDTSVGVNGFANPPTGPHEFIVPDGRVGFFTVPPDAVVVVEDTPSGAKLTVTPQAFFTGNTYVVESPFVTHTVPRDGHLHVQGLSPTGEIVVTHKSWSSDGAENN